VEDSALFNAGKGAYLNIENDIEFDAGLMDGKTLKVGAIAAAKKYQQPYSFGIQDNDRNRPLPHSWRGG